jgi:addiction module RelE/StbE family toxin
MRVRWTVPAADDLENIYYYLLNNHPQVAESTVRAIYQQIKNLKMSPNRGRPGHRNGTRELPISDLPYIVVYAVKAEAVEILHVYHGAQDWR